MIVFIGSQGFVRIMFHYEKLLNTGRNFVFFVCLARGRHEKAGSRTTDRCLLLGALFTANSGNSTDLLVHSTRVLIK